MSSQRLVLKESMHTSNSNHGNSHAPPTSGIFCLVLVVAEGMCGMWHQAASHHY